MVFNLGGLGNLHVVCAKVTESEVFIPGKKSSGKTVEGGAWNVLVDAEKAYKNKDYDKVLKICQEFITRQKGVYLGTSSAPKILILQGDVYKEKKEFEKAISSYNEVVEKYGGEGKLCKKALYQIGETYQELGLKAIHKAEASKKKEDFLQAKTYLEKACDSYQEARDFYGDSAKIRRALQITKRLLDELAKIEKGEVKVKKVDDEKRIYALAQAIAESKNKNNIAGRREIEAAGLKYDEVLKYDGTKGAKDDIVLSFELGTYLFRQESLLRVKNITTGETYIVEGGTLKKLETRTTEEIKKLSNSDPKIQIKALCTLEELQVKEAISNIAVQLTNIYPAVRKKAIEVLENFKVHEQKYLNEIKQRLEDDDKAVREAALKALRSLGCDVEELGYPADPQNDH